MLQRIGRFYHRVLRLSVRAVVRDQEKIITEYTRWWGTGKRINTLFEPTKLERNGYPLLLPKIEYEKGMILKLAEHLEGDSAIELGSGDGLNLLCLSMLRPDIKKWVGIELTEAGIEQARKYLISPPQKVIKFITGQEFHSKGSIEFLRGDMTKVAFPDNSFYTVFSKQAIEQLPRDYLKAFAEAHRLARIGIFIEQFRDYQKFKHLLYLRRKGYFRWPSSEVERVGFKIARFEPILLHKELYELGFLVAKNARS